MNREKQINPFIEENFELKENQQRQQQQQHRISE